jgi:hypothetical protein
MFTPPVALQSIYRYSPIALSPTPSSYFHTEHTLWAPLSCFSSSASLIPPSRLLNTTALTSQSQYTWRRAQTRSATLQLTCRQKRLNPNAARFRSFDKVIIKQVRSYTRSATILANLLLLPVGIQFVKHIWA